MGFNLGVALGAAATTGLNTYERLGEEELRDMQRKKMRQEMEQEKALDTAFAQTQGRVGQQNDYAQAIQAQGGAGSTQAKMLSDQAAGMGPENEAASAQSVVGALRQNAGQADVAPSAIAPQAYTQAQAAKDYKQQAAGVSRKGYLEALQLGSATRASDLEDRFDTAQTQFQDHLTKIHSAGETGGMKGLSDAANKEGLKTRFKEGKNGLGIIEVLGPKGDVLKTYNDTKAATDALVGTASKHFQDSLVTMFGSADKAAAYYETRRGNDIKEKEANDKGVYYNAVANAYNTGMKGGSKETIKAKADEYADALVESKQINPKTKAPYTKEEAKTFAYDVILKNPNVKAASDWKSVPGGDGSLQENGQGQQREWDPKTKSYIIRGEVNPIVEAFANHDPNAKKEDKPKAAPTAALPVKPEVTQLRGAVSPSNLRNLPLPSGYNGKNVVAKPQDSEEIRKALF